jgi:hypothetical protein
MFEHGEKSLAHGAMRTDNRDQMTEDRGCRVRNGEYGRRNVSSLDFENQRIKTRIPNSTANHT